MRSLVRERALHRIYITFQSACRNVDCFFFCTSIDRGYAWSRKLVACFQLDCISNLRTMFLLTFKTRLFIMRANVYVFFERETLKFQSEWNQEKNYTNLLTFYNQFLLRSELPQQIGRIWLLWVWTSTGCSKCLAYKLRCENTLALTIDMLTQFMSQTLVWYFLTAFRSIDEVQWIDLYDGDIFGWQWQSFFQFFDSFFYFSSLCFFGTSSAKNIRDCIAKFSVFLKEVQ